MSRSLDLHRALLLGLALLAGLGGAPLHELVHHEPLGAAQDGSQLHGDDCEHGVETEHPRHDAQCLLCSVLRAGGLDRPDVAAALAAPAPTLRWTLRPAPAAPREGAVSGPLGARAPPREA